MVQGPGQQQLQSLPPGEAAAGCKLSTATFARAPVSASAQPSACETAAAVAPRLAGCRAAPLRVEVTYAVQQQPITVQTPLAAPAYAPGKDCSWTAVPAAFSDGSVTAAPSDTLHCICSHCSGQACGQAPAQPIISVSSNASGSAIEQPSIWLLKAAGRVKTMAQGSNAAVVPTPFLSLLGNGQMAASTMLQVHT